MKRTFLALGLFVAGGFTALAATSSSFSDVSEGDWFYKGVQYSNENGLMTGYDNKKFGPNDVVNRAQLATVLERMDAGSIEKLLIELKAIRNYETNEMMGSSWLEYLDAMRRFPVNGIQGSGEASINPDVINNIKVVATDQVNGVKVLSNESVSANTTAAFFLETSGMGAGMFGPFYDNLGRIVKEVEGENTNLITDR